AARVADGAGGGGAVAPVDGRGVRVQRARVGKRGLERGRVRLADGLVGDRGHDGGQVGDGDGGGRGDDAAGGVGDRQRHRVTAGLHELEGGVGAGGGAAVGEGP